MTHPTTHTQLTDQLDDFPTAVDTPRLAPVDNLMAAVLTVSLADAGDSSALAVLETTEDSSERVGLFTRRGVPPATAAAYAGLDATLVRLAFTDPEAAVDGIAARASDAGGSGTPGEAA